VAEENGLHNALINDLIHAYHPLAAAGVGLY
jgi:hypothetical protein